MNYYRLALIAAGAIAVGVIAFAMSMAPMPVALLPGAAMLMVTYAAGLTLGRVMWKRGG
jgi:hypothetical protein